MGRSNPSAGGSAGEMCTRLLARQGISGYELGRQEWEVRMGC